MKRQKILWLGWLMGIVIGSFLLTGCATGPAPAPAPSRMEDMLVRAGFKAVPESHPKCQQVCGKLPPDQLVPEREGNKLAYAYFAPETRLLYVGDETAYRRFIDLAVIENLGPRRRAVMEAVPNDPEFWRVWQDMHGGG
jgi:hypothetical protein